MNFSKNLILLAIFLAILANASVIKKFQEES